MVFSLSQARDGPRSYRSYHVKRVSEAQRARRALARLRRTRGSPGWCEPEVRLAIRHILISAMIICLPDERGVSMNRKRFEGKVALVTGAGSRRGIGRATALALAEEGAKVAITDIAAEGVQSVAAELNKIGPAFGAVADVRDKQAMTRVVERAVSEFGGLDILMNIAGITRPTPFLDTSEEEYDLILDINLKGMFLTTQAAVPALLERGGGVFGASAYSASKAGVMGLTKALARELSPRGIRVNCVAPSMIDTDITGAPLTEERKAALSKDVLLGRIGTVNDVVPCLLFLASDESAYLTGVTLDINGGMHMH